MLGIGSMCGRFPYIDVPFKKVTKYIYPIWCKLLRGTTNGCPDVVQARVIGYDVVSDPRDPTTFWEWYTPIISWQGDWISRERKVPRWNKMRINPSFLIFLRWLWTAWSKMMMWTFKEVQNHHLDVHSCQIRWDRRLGTWHGKIMFIHI